MRKKSVPHPVNFDGTKRAGGKTVRKCSKCKGVGHNARTCGRTPTPMLVAPALSAVSVATDTAPQLLAASKGEGGGNSSTNNTSASTVFVASATIVSGDANGKYHEGDGEQRTNALTPASEFPSDYEGYTAEELGVLWTLTHPIPPMDGWREKDIEALEDFLTSVESVSDGQALAGFLLAYVKHPIFNDGPGISNEVWNSALLKLSIRNRNHLLTSLSVSHIPGTRVYVAVQSKTPPDVLTALAADAHVSVRWHVAKNPATPPDVLISMASDANETVRRGVSQNTATPPSVLASLMHDPNQWVRRGVAFHSATPHSILTQMSFDSDKYIRGCVASNPSAPPEVLTRLASDPELHVRRRAAHELTAPVRVS